MVQHIINF